MKTPQSNKNIILISAVIALISLIYGVSNFRRAFPEIAVDFALSKPEVMTLATEFLESRHFDITDYRTSIIFQADNLAKVFLERELGVERTIALTEDSLAIWYWSVRAFKPLQKLEYRVRISPSGEIVGFSRYLKEDTPGPSLDKESARSLSEAFLSGKMLIDLAEWNLVESSTVDKPTRKDHLFEYEQIDFEEAEAHYRIEVGIQGAAVGSFREYLKVPQVWQRDYERLRERNNMYQIVTQLFMFLLIIAVIVHFIKHIRLRQIHWKPILWLSGILTGLILLVTINSIPLAEAGYSTTDSYSAFMGKLLMFGLIGASIQGLFVLLLLGAGEYKYRQDHPNKLYLGGLLSRRGMRTREFIQATLMGYILAAFHIGFVVFYYVMGKKIGFWSPAEINYTDAVSTVAPWIFPLAISVMAAFSEEFMFRYFGISFLRQFLKSLPLAVILQAFIWGFLHSAYPQQPGFARGIEVGLIGIAAGVVMLRFGIWATLTWHFVIDAVLIGLFLFQSSNAYFWISGLIICGGLTVPAIIAAVHYFRKRGFEEASDLLNSAVKQPQPIEPLRPVELETKTQIAVDGSYIPLSRKARRYALLFGVLGILLMLIPGQQQFGEDYYPRIDRSEAITVAKKAIEARYNINPDDYLISAKISSVDLDAYSFAKRNLDQAAAEEILVDPGGGESNRWNVFFKREFKPDYYKVWVSAITGEAFPIHILADTTSGLDLKIDSARVLAEAIFKDSESLADRYHLISERAVAKLARTDHEFLWETIDPIISDPQFGEAHFRRKVEIRGESVEVYPRIVKLPEEWKRHEDENSGFWPINLVLLLGLILGFGVYTVVSLGKGIVRHDVRWRNGIILGIVAGVVLILRQWNDWATIWVSYRTATPMSSHISASLINTVVGALFTALFVALIIALCEALIKGRYGRSAWELPKQSGRAAGEDATIIVLGIIGVAAGLNWLTNGLEHWLALPVHTWQAAITDSLTTRFPWYDSFGSAFQTALLRAGLILTAFLLFENGIRRRWIRLALMVIAAVAVAGPVVANQGNLTSGEIIWRTVKNLVYIASFYAVLKYWIRERLWVLIAAIFLGAILRSGLNFISWTHSPYPVQGWILICIAVMTALWMVLKAIRARE